MKRILFLIITASLFLGVSAQKERPKIGLVLSGGGAKGVAHIGVLKAMEEAGLTPDYITGTSMGSIMGGLYSIGYSADELAELVTTVNWDQVLTNKIPLNKVTFEEKAYYGRYLADLYLDNKQLRYPSGVIEGQALLDLFSDLTRPVHNTTDFKKFPVPFECVATNIATGEPIILNKGSLAAAMRASMAIPTVFTPITIDGNLLVDGGLVRNMPVQEVLDMGADIVIGVFVSSDLSPAEDLTSFISILAQSALINGVMDTREQLKLCNILVTPDLKGFSTGSFHSSKEILERGMEAGQKYVEVFRHLADSLKQFGPLHEIKKPEIKKNYVFSHIQIEGNQFVTDDFIKGKLNFEPGKETTIDALKDHLNLIYGTQYFEKVQYEILENEDDYTLRIMVVERPRTHLRLSYHYDSENHGGIILNSTFRNMILRNSRMILETDLSSYPKFKLDYFKYAGKKQNFALGLSGIYLNTILPLYDSLGVSNNIFGSNYYEGAVKLQSTGLRNSTYGVKINWSLTNLNAKVTEERIRELTKISYNNTRFTLFYDYNSLEERYFAKKGSIANLDISATTSTHGKIRVSDVDYDLTHLGDAIQTSTIWALKAEVEPIIKVSQKFSVITKARLMLSNIKDNSLNLNEFDFVGGFTPDLVNTNEYYGSNFKEYGVANYFYYRLGGQYEVFRNFFVQGHFNFLSTEYPVKWLYNNADIGKLGRHTSRYSLAGKVGFLSPIGPIAFAFAKDHYAQGMKASLIVGFTY